jgi:T1SS-143 domain-containing protein
MTCNHLILAQPEAGASIDYSIPTGESAKLSFEPGDIMGLSLTETGALKLSFTDGGSLTIENFQAMVDGGNILYLADGTMIDPKLLEAGLNHNQFAKADDTLLIDIPQEGVVNEITLEPGQEYVFGFGLNDPKSAEMVDGKFVMTFANGGQIVLSNYQEAMAFSNPPSLSMNAQVCEATNQDLIITLQQLALGLPVDGITKEEEEAAEKGQRKSIIEVSNMDAETAAQVEPAAGDAPKGESADELAELADILADVEPAAGDDSSSNSGYGYGSTPGNDPLIAPGAVGPLGATALNYNAPQFQQQSYIPEILAAVQDDIPAFGAPPDHTLDETNLSPLSVSGKVSVSFGVDTPGLIIPNTIVQVSGSLTGGILSSGGVAVTITPTADGYVGMAGAVSVFTFVIDASTGEYTYTQIVPFDHADGTNPNDAILIKFGIRAQDADGDAANSTVNITILDDAPMIDSAFAVVDETDLDAPVIVNGQLNFDIGNDNAAGGVSATGVFSASGSMKAGALTHGGVPVTVSLVGDTYIGTAGGTTIFTLQLLADGKYTFQLLETLDHGDPNDPNDIITLNFGVVATDFDGDGAKTNIKIHVKDDVPTIGDSAGAIDESQFDNGATLVHTDTLISSFGLDIASIVPGGSFTASVGGAPLALMSNDVAVIVTQTANGYVGMAGATTVFTLTINSATGQYTYTQLETLDHPNGEDHNDSIDLTFSVAIESADGDSDTGVISLSVFDDGVNAKNDINAAEEDQFITGDVRANDDLSQDADNTVMDITYDGVKYVIPANGQVTIATDFGTFIMKSDGTYSFQVTAEDPNGFENFTYTLRDGDGDRDTAQLSIQVSEDGTPVAVSSRLAVDETNVTPGPMIFNGHMDVDFGRDGVGSITPNGGVTPSGSMAAGALTSQGVPVIITQTATGYIGMAGTVHVFTLNIQDNGDYSFQLFDRFDHADKTDPNDLIHLDFGVTIMDADGDTADGIVRIEVYDDAPVAYDDITSAEEGQIITGNLLENDELSEDRPNTVVKIKFEGTEYNVPTTGNLTIEGDFGTFVVNNAGRYTYTTHNDDPNGTDVFTYTLRDYDGDQDTAELSIRVTPDGTPVAVNESLEVDETNLSGGPVVFTDNMNPDFGLDGVGTITPNGTFLATQSLAGGALTHHGIPVVVTATANGYVGVAGTQTIFTLTIANNGDYTFTLNDTLDHADATAPDDAIRLEFGVNIADSDGDTVPGYVKVIINDDAPVAYDDNGGLVDENQTVSGNVINNDLKSQDDANTISKVLFNGATYTVPSAGQLTIIGIYGTLKIDKTGAYTYTATSSVAADVVETFTYTLRDGEGDSDTAEISFKVRQDDQPIIVNGLNQVDETGGFDTVSGTVSVNYGGDGPGVVMGTNVFSSSYALTSVGVPVVVSFNAGTNTYTGKAGATTVFTMVVNANGTYTFTQLDQLDHANASDPNDAMNLVFGVKATDADGDVGTGNVTIKVLDDGPVANDDNGGDVAAGAAKTGNVLTNDVVGADVDGRVIIVNFNGVNTTVALGATATINGAHGSLLIKGDGSYTYTANAAGNGTDNFTYTLKDYDGDTDPAILSFCVKPVDLDPPTVLVNNGVEKICIKEDGQGTVPVKASYTGGDGDEVLSLTLKGSSVAGWTITAPGWTKVGADWVITLPAGQKTYAGNITFKPPANSDADLPALKVEAKLYDPDTGLTKTSFDDFKVTTDAVADGANLTVPGAAANGANGSLYLRNGVNTSRRR